MPHFPLIIICNNGELSIVVLQDYSTIIETMAFTKMTEFSYTILDHE